ncbi:uncharacterized protein [Physcomitrium patens]|nr:uncharacterized protein LOC112293633 [Physcomitrium patens]XP_024399055.1 uncharacterized protein LOC112293633 [Physcomitrium patens]|eukprot:XP_024399054.1 uncharacterized protein LOC112293633 [Physcomitrella patens]
MGCTTSRDRGISSGDKERFGSRRRLGKSNSYTPLRSSNPRDLHYDYHIVALTSSTYGLTKLLEAERMNEHMVPLTEENESGELQMLGYSKMRKSDSMSGRERAPKTWADMAMGCSRFKSEQIRKDQTDPKSSLLRQMEPSESSETEIVNTWELMEGLDDNAPLVSPLSTSTNSTKQNDMVSITEVPPGSIVKTLSRSRSASAVDGLRMLSKAGIVPDLFCTDSTSSITQFLTKQSFDYISRGSMDFSQRFSGPHSSADLPSGQVMGFPLQDSRCLRTVFPTIPNGEVTGSNLFDPDIIATFQDAMDKTAWDDDWCHIGSNEVQALSSIKTIDNHILMQWPSSKKNDFGYASGFHESTLADSRFGTFGSDRTSFAKVIPVGVEKPRLHVIVDSLWKYEEKCPPGGEHRVVLYLTSLRGIRQTFEDCQRLKMIFQSFPIWIDERDVSMHAEFRQELKSLFSEPAMVPRVFIKGHYIGGFDEVRRLHEDGELGELLQDLPAVPFKQACDGCGGVRFVPCPECNGGCKIITASNEVARCPNCNENGLIRCPVCF